MFQCRCILFNNQNRFESQIINDFKTSLPFLTAATTTQEEGMSFKIYEVLSYLKEEQRNKAVNPLI